MYRIARIPRMLLSVVCNGNVFENDDVESAEGCTTRYIHYKTYCVGKKIETHGGMFLNKLRAVMHRASD